MKIKVLAFLVVVLIIIVLLLFSKPDKTEFCKDTTKAAEEYRADINTNLNNDDWKQAIRNYVEYESCFGENKDYIKKITTYLSQRFESMAEEEKYGEIINEYKFVTETVDNELFEEELRQYVFSSYEEALEPYEDAFQNANFVLNTSAQFPACSAYITIYEDMKQEIKKEELFEIEKNVQLCYVLEANKYRYGSNTVQNVDSAIENYEEAIFLNIQNPVHNHAVKVEAQLTSCVKQQGTCVSEQLQKECLNIEGPSTGFVDCNLKEVCCKAFE